MADDILCILDRSKFNDVFQNFASENLEAIKGLVCINDYFGTMNDDWVEGEKRNGSGYIKNIIVMDKNGVGRKIDVKAYYDKVSSEVKEYMKKNGDNIHWVDIFEDEQTNPDKMWNIVEDIAEYDVKHRDNIFNIFLKTKLTYNETVFYVTEGTDIMNSGSGLNTVIVKGDNWGDNIINLTKNEVLNIDLSDYNYDSSDFKFTLTGNDLKLSIKNKGSFTLKNYLKADIKSLNLDFGSDNVVTYNSVNDFTIFEYDEKAISKSGVLTSSAYKDEIDLKDVINPYKTDKNGTKIGYTINAGNDSDTITGTQFNDTITGGSGENTIIITNDSNGFGNDTVNLTKDEKLILDFTAYTSITKVSDLKMNLVGNNLVIKTDKGTLTLANYAKINLDSLNFKLYDSSAEGNYTITTFKNISELKENATFYYDESDISTKGIVAGSAYNDKIDLTGVGPYKTDKKGTKIGYTINSGNGRDTITGTDYNDTITSGTGSSNIDAGDGDNIVTVTGTAENTKKGTVASNNIITTGSGNDTIKVLNGDSNITAGAGLNFVTLGIGNHTINIGSTHIFSERPTDMEILENIGTTTITPTNVKSKEKINLAVGTIDDYLFERGVSENYVINGKKYSITENDLVVYQLFNIDGIEDTIKAKTLVIQNYFKTNKEITITYGSNSTKLSEVDIFIDYTDLDEKNSGLKNYTIKGTDFSDTITGGRGNDTITGGKGTDTINGGAGINTLKFSVGDGKDIVLNSEGTDILSFVKGTNVTAELSNDGTLTINYGNGEDSITVNDWDESHSVQYIQIGSAKQAIKGYYITEDQINAVAQSLTAFTSDNDYGALTELANASDDISNTLSVSNYLGETDLSQNNI